MRATLSNRLVALVRISSSSTVKSITIALTTLVGEEILALAGSLYPAPVALSMLSRGRCTWISAK
eukprot:c43867_g1_i1 orf=111-305(+)